MTEYFSPLTQSPTGSQSNRHEAPFTFTELDLRVSAADLAEGTQYAPGGSCEFKHQMPVSSPVSQRPSVSQQLSRIESVDPTRYTASTHYIDFSNHGMTNSSEPKGTTQPFPPAEVAVENGSGCSSPPIGETAHEAMQRIEGVATLAVTPTLPGDDNPPPVPDQTELGAQDLKDDEEGSPVAIPHIDEQGVQSNSAPSVELPPLPAPPAVPAPVPAPAFHPCPVSPDRKGKGVIPATPLVRTRMTQRLTQRPTQRKRKKLFSGMLFLVTGLSSTHLPPIRNQEERPTWYSPEHRRLVGRSSGDRLVQRLTKLVVNHGGTVATDEYDIRHHEGCTKGVVLSEELRPTLKCLSGLSRGMVPVHFSWVLHSVLLRQQAQFDKFLLTSLPENHTQLFSNRSVNGYLTGCRVFVDTNPRKKLFYVEAFELCGAQVATELGPGCIWFKEDPLKPDEPLRCDKVVTTEEWLELFQGGSATSCFDILRSTPLQISPEQKVQWTPKRASRKRLRSFTSPIPDFSKRMRRVAPLADAHFPGAFVLFAAGPGITKIGKVETVSIDSSLDIREYVRSNEPHRLEPAQNDNFSVPFDRVISVLNVLTKEEFNNTYYA